ncbi:MAG: adenosylcobinamide-phosphate synthase CbiB [Myxococcales bacterium]
MLLPGASALALGVAFLLDASVGEPWTPLHPVVWMGRMIAPLKRLGRQPMRAPATEWMIGCAYALAVVGSFAGGSWLLQSWLNARPWLALSFEVYVLLGCFALKGLVAAGDGVRRALNGADLAAARYGLGSLCSRDASDLSERELAGAAIESLTENTSDSLVAPLFYYVLFGLPGAVLYRAANTLDAMVGYHGRFEYLGKFAARLDDVLNLVPARLTACALALAGLLLRLDVGRGLRVWRRDRAATESPNAGHPMAMGAGLLGVQLDKRDAYVLGAGLAAPDAAALGQAQRLIRLTGWIVALASIGLLLWRGKYGV